MSESERIVVVKLRAEIEDYKKKLAEARDEARKLSVEFDRDGKAITTQTGRIIRSAEIHRDSWQEVGGALTKFGATGVAALGLAAKAAWDWESAWAGVLKTVDGSPEQLSRLEDQLRSLAMVKSASHTEIAAVAEAAGQLGVATENVAAFTAVMIDLGETTNLSADEAATSIAQFMNIMQTVPGEVDRLGAALVALGNNGASTERDIIQMAQRIAGAARPIGLTEAQVLGLANALASVGIEVEAGGSAISNIMIDISRDVSNGGDKLREWARVAGLTAADFASKWKSDPAEALTLMVQGMGQLNDRGEDVFATLSALGQTDVRVTRAMLSMAYSGDMLSDSLALGTQAWSDNLALVEEAEKRYDTTEAKMSMARNAINEAAIELGEHLLPIIAAFADRLAGVAEWFAALPEPLQRFLTVAGAVVSVGALMAGGLALLVPRIVATHAAFRTLAADMPVLSSRMGTAAGAASKLGLVMGALVVGSGIPKWGTDSAEGIGQTTQALLDLVDGVDLADTSLGEMLKRGGFKDWFTGNEIDSVEAAWRWLKEPSLAAGAENIISSVLTLGQTTSTSRLQAQELFNTIDQGLASLVASGDPDAAAAALDKLGVPLEYQAELLPLYADALADTENQTRLNAGAASDLTSEMVTYGEALEDAIKLQRQAAGVALDEWDALTRYAAAVESATQALREGGPTLDAYSESGRRNRDALADIAEATWDWVEAGVAAGESQVELAARMSEGRQAMIHTGEQAGLTAEEVEALADTFGLVPASVTSIFTVDTSQAVRQINQLRALYSDAQFGNYSVARTGYFSGGPISGPGTETSDSILIRASNNEYMIRAAAHRMYGTSTLDALNRGDTHGLLRSIASRGFRDGGSIGERFHTGINTSAAMAGTGAGLTRSDLIAFAQQIAQSNLALADSRIDVAVDEAHAFSSQGGAV